ncbi:MAG: thioredoxin family protein [Thermoplasmatota archaeon]
MAQITGEHRSFMEKEFQKMSEAVKINVHLPAGKCETCDELKELINEIAEATDHLQVSFIEEDSAEDGGYNYIVDRLPAVAVLDKEGKSRNIIYYGLPSANLFHSLISLITMQSTGNVDMDEENIEKVKGLEGAEIQLFVTPNTPKASETIDVASRFAMLNDEIHTSVIELIEFPEMAERYQVLGVPKTIVNEEIKFTGAYDAGELLEIIINKISDVEV